MVLQRRLERVNLLNGPLGGKIVLLFRCKIGASLGDEYPGHPVNTLGVVKC